MTDRRRTIYLPRSLDAALAARGVGAGVPLSAAIASMCARYCRAVDTSLPQLTMAQWRDIIAAAPAEIDDATIGTIWAHVADRDEALAAEIRAMPWAARCAIVDAIERYRIAAAAAPDDPPGVIITDILAASDMSPDAATTRGPEGAGEGDQP